MSAQESERATDELTLPGRLRAPGATWASTQDTRAEGRYELRGILGTGGMSVVYDAFDTLLGREVALKELLAESDLDPGLLVREARALASVQHPNVVALYGLHFEGPGHPFFVMERVVGETLDERMRRGPIDVPSAIALLAHTAAGIDAIHAAGLAHGDVKPSNVLVDARDVAKVVDIGVFAYLARGAADHVVGTPAYIAPERTRHVAASARGAERADVYSFGVLAYELLAGRRPFVGEPDALMRAHARETPPPPGQIAPSAAAFDVPLLRALAKDPAARPRTCTQLVDALRKSAEGVDRHGRPLRLLVVEDDRDQRELIEILLGSELTGAVVESAPDGGGALRAIDRAQPDVVVLDLAMPGLSGTALVRRVRERAPDAAIIVVTGHGSGADWTEARALGARRFYVKPVDPFELLRAIRDLAPL